MVFIALICFYQGCLVLVLVLGLGVNVQAKIAGTDSEG